MSWLLSKVRSESKYLQIVNVYKYKNVSVWGLFHNYNRWEAYSLIAYIIWPKKIKDIVIMHVNINIWLYYIKHIVFL